MRSIRLQKDLKQTPKHLNPVISQKLKGKEKRARVLKKLKTI
jgi:hypothetical protein